MKERQRLLLALLLSLFIFPACQIVRQPAPPDRIPDTTRRYSVKDRLVQFGPRARKRWLPRFLSAKVQYPPSQITLVALKTEQVLEVYAGGESIHWITSFPICAASGARGPKLQEGDMQVPEGIYSIPYLNPNSRFHLSLRVNYPNKFDRLMARLDRRSFLGGDIMIHGKCRSTGCLAVGDLAAEDLFVLAADSGVENIKLLITPCDLRTPACRALPTDHLPPWVPQLYSQLEAEIRSLPQNIQK